MQCHNESKIENSLPYRELRCTRVRQVEALPYRLMQCQAATLCHSPQCEWGKYKTGCIDRHVLDIEEPDAVMLCFDRAFPLYDISKVCLVQVKLEKEKSVCTWGLLMLLKFSFV